MQIPSIILRRNQEYGNKVAIIKQETFCRMILPFIKRIDNEKAMLMLPTLTV